MNREELEIEVSRLRAYVSELSKMLAVNWNGSPADRVVVSAVSSALDEVARLRKGRNMANIEVSCLRACIGTLRSMFGCVGRNVADAPAEQHTREIAAAVRASQNERAIAELDAMFLWVWDVKRPDCLPRQEHAEAWQQLVCEIRQRCRERVDALRAETPVTPQPAPNGGVELAIAELTWVASMMHGGAFDPAWTKARVDIDTRIAALRALRAETPAALAPVTPQRPSYAERARELMSVDYRNGKPAERCMLALIIEMLDDALAARGGAQ